MYLGKIVEQGAGRRALRQPAAPLHAGAALLGAGSLGRPAVARRSCCSGDVPRPIDPPQAAASPAAASAARPLPPGVAAARAGGRQHAAPAGRLLQPCAARRGRRRRGGRCPSRSSAARLTASCCAASVAAGSDVWLVLLHDVGRRPRLLADAAEPRCTARGWSSVALDLRGHGGSDGDGGATVPRWTSPRRDAGPRRRRRARRAGRGRRTAVSALEATAAALAEPELPLADSLVLLSPAASTTPSPPRCGPRAWRCCCCTAPWTRRRPRTRRTCCAWASAGASASASAASCRGRRC